MSEKLTIIIIDPQNDFCRHDGNILTQFLQSGIPRDVEEKISVIEQELNGSLYVPGGDEDMKRMAKLISKRRRDIQDIRITLDSHHWFSIFHPCFILDKNGNHPSIFTPILHQDVINGNYRAAHPAFQKHLEFYTKELEAHGRSPLVIWPYHCLIGLPGSDIYQPLAVAVREWETSPATTTYLIKGSNFLVEHYSPLRAEVELKDPATKLNTGWIKELSKPGIKLVGGEASTHCLRFFMEDLVRDFGPDSAKDIIVLEDTTSPVPTFEETYTKFKKEMQLKGVRFALSTDFM